MELVEALISCTKLFPSGYVSLNSSRIQSGADILGAYVRHLCLWSQEDSVYSDWLDGVIDRFNRLDEPKRVIGRVYSAWGIADVRSLNRSYLELIILNTQSRWKISDSWLKVLFSDLVGQSARDRLIRTLKEWVGLIDSDYQKGWWIEDGRDSQVINSRESFVSCIDLLEEKGKTEILEAEVDLSRLETLSQYGSSVDVFDARDRHFPLTLFGEVVKSENVEIGKERVINIVDYAKANVINVGVTPPGNEKEWISDIVQNNIVGQIFGDFISASTENLTSLSYGDEQRGLDQLKTDINKRAEEGYEPIIFAGPKSLLSRANVASYGRGTDSDVEYKGGYGDFYICHYRGVPVYRIPFSSANYLFVVSKKYFLKASLFALPNGKYVNVQYVPEDELTGKLRLSYRLSTTFGSESVFKYLAESHEEVSV